MNNTFNFDNVFFRMVTVSLAKTLNRKIRWIYYFQDGKKCITLPFYVAMAGQERFLLDAFNDDITGTRVELNTDQIPRGTITLTSFAPASDEFANPNIYIPKRVKLHNKLRELWTRVKAVPMTMSYDIEIRLDNERDVYVCSEKILYLLFNYRFFRMDYFGINIQNILLLPDDKTIEYPREINLTSDNIKSIKFPLTVRTYYPIWSVDTDNLECEDEEIENIKRVYWDVYIHELKDLTEDELENIDDIDSKRRENFGTGRTYNESEDDGYIIEL